MTGYNDGKTAQEVAEIISEMRHASSSHKETVSEAGKARKAHEARRRIEEIEDARRADDCELVGLKAFESKILTKKQKRRIRESNEKSGYGRWML